MPEPDGAQELTGIARSIDALFVRLEGDKTRAPDRPATPADVVEVVPPSGPAPAPVEAEAVVAPDEPLAPVGDAPPPLDLDVEVAPPPLPEVEPAPPSPLEVEAAPPPLPDLDPEPKPVTEISLDAELEIEGALTEAAEPPPLPMLDGPSEPVSSIVPDAPSSRPESESGDDDESEHPTELDLAVDAYLEGESSRSAEIERLGREMLERRELDSVARSVVRLTIAAGDPPDAATYAAAESLMDPLVLEHVVRRLGGERVEETRGEYYRACATIGEPMALALRDGLADTATDRLARRNYCDALRAMGDVARPTIEAMAVDDNRFVSRNALTILGEVGGPRALELVTGQLGNPDARVRREALRSMARIGDAESGGKLIELGLLNDSDEDVRMAAAVAAGELRVVRAVRPLLEMLEETKDPDRAIPLIRALGQLEDPSAVTALERFAVPSLFSKPRTDVRIAAYRALYHIGTPHAMKLLAKASSDKDAAVSSAVLALRKKE